MFADNNGNIVTTTLYTRQNQTYRGMQFSVFNGANGLRKAVVYTDQLNANVSFNVSLGSIGLAQNTLYISAHICGSGLCSGSDTLNLYAIPVTGLGMDYPRARVQGVAATTQTSRKYVALGDSFSAGESVEPFSAPSDSDGCHRSTQAYAELLDQDPALNLDLQAFAACSGATTATVAGGMNGESSQLDSLSTDDDVVTITVGGNDAKFVDFATECFNLTPGSHCDGSGQYDQTMGLIENSLPANLDDLFDEVKGRIGESTRVLVVGYPRLMPYVGDPLDCAYLSTQERTAIMDVTNGLNGALRTAAQNAGSQFEFVDADAILDGVRLSPFAGHELCASDNYFNGATLPVGYSYHPNRQGQAAYEELVRDYLLNGSNIG
jgi:lysophospholipase L1-like esterase